MGQVVDKCCRLPFLRHTPLRVRNSSMHAPAPELFGRYNAAIYDLSSGVALCLSSAACISLFASTNMPKRVLLLSDLHCLVDFA